MKGEKILKKQNSDATSNIEKVLLLAKLTANKARDAARAAKKVSKDTNNLAAFYSIRADIVNLAKTASNAATAAENAATAAKDAADAAKTASTKAKNAKNAARAAVLATRAARAATRAALAARKAYRAAKAAYDAAKKQIGGTFSYTEDSFSGARIDDILTNVEDAENYAKLANRDADKASVSAILFNNQSSSNNAATDANKYTTGTAAPATADDGEKIAFVNPLYNEEANFTKPTVKDSSNLSFGVNSNYKQKKNKANNVAFGQNSLMECENGIKNIGFGINALKNVTSSSNIGFGANAGLKLKTGNNNIFVGLNSDCSSENSFNQIALGSGAKGHGNHRLTFGGTEIEGYKKNALVSIHPGVTDYTDLGSKEKIFNKIYVSKLNCNKDLTLTLPIKESKKYDFVKIDKNGNMSYSRIKRMNGLILNTRLNESPLTITSASGTATITLDNIENAKGRLLLDSNTTSLHINFTASDFFKKFQLNKPFDFLDNFLISIDKQGTTGVVNGTVTDATSFALTQANANINVNDEIRNLSSGLVISTVASVSGTTINVNGNVTVADGTTLSFDSPLQLLSAFSAYTPPRFTTTDSKVIITHSDGNPKIYKDFGSHVTFSRLSDFGITKDSSGNPIDDNKDILEIHIKNYGDYI